MFSYVSDNRVVVLIHQQQVLAVLSSTSDVIHVEGCLFILSDGKTAVGQAPQRGTSITLLVIV